MDSMGERMDEMEKSLLDLMESSSEEKSATEQDLK
jgi:hypothetical protein